MYSNSGLDPFRAECIGEDTESACVLIHRSAWPSAIVGEG